MTSIPVEAQPCCCTEAAGNGPANPGMGRLALPRESRLHDAGYTDVVVFDGPPALEAIRSKERAANPVTRAWERLSTYLASENDARQAALDALGQGHAIVMVNASSRAQEDQVADILQAHRALALTYFGR